MFYFSPDQTYERIKESKIESEIHLTDAPSTEKYFNENHKTFRGSKWFYDTPGVIQNEQTINMLTSEELLYTIPKQTLWPRSFYIESGNSVFISGLGRIDYIGGASNIRVAIFASDKLSIFIVKTDKADELYQTFLGTEVLNVPRGDVKRLETWPKLQRRDEKISVANYYQEEELSVCGMYSTFQHYFLVFFF